MSSFEWTDIYILPDAFPCLINNEFLSDVRFQFDDKKIIYAHKFVLCLRSLEFFRYFKEYVGARNLIIINDVSSAAFLEFLHFLYTDQIVLNESNAADLLRLAIKYRVNVLETQCKELIFSTVTDDNVCVFLDSALMEDWIELQYSCLNYIALNYDIVLKNKSLLDINQQTLLAIIELEPVTDVKEFDVFKALIAWADRACERSGLKPSGSNQRNKLGDVVKSIKFGSMSAKDFSKCQDIAPDLLHKDEIIEIFNGIASRRQSGFGFPSKQRRILTSDQKLDFKTYGTILFTNYLSSAKYYTPSQLLDKYYLKFSSTILFRVEKLNLNILENYSYDNRPFINYEIYENGKLFQTGKRDLVSSSIEIHPVTIIPNNVYCIEYEFDLGNIEALNKLIARKYEMNENKTIIYKRKPGFAFTIHENNSHINHLKISYY